MPACCSLPFCSPWPTWSACPNFQLPWPFQILRFCVKSYNGKGCKFSILVEDHTFILRGFQWDLGVYDFFPTKMLHLHSPSDVSGRGKAKPPPPPPTNELRNPRKTSGDEYIHHCEARYSYKYFNLCFLFACNTMCHSDISRIKPFMFISFFMKSAFPVTLVSNC